MSGLSAAASGDSSGSMGSGNAAALGGDAGPSTSGNIKSTPTTGSIYFNFGAPGGFVGGGASGGGFPLLGVATLVVVVLVGGWLYNGRKP